MGLLHWSRPTVYRLINSGELPAIRTGTGKGRGHSYALHSLQAGVPIATLARQMGHSDVSRTFTVYGGWVREMGPTRRRYAGRGSWLVALMRRSTQRNRPSHTTVRVPPSASDPRYVSPSLAHRPRMRANTVWAAGAPAGRSCCSPRRRRARAWLTSPRRVWRRLGPGRPGPASRAHPDDQLGRGGRDRRRAACTDRISEAREQCRVAGVRIRGGRAAASGCKRQDDKGGGGAADDVLHEYCYRQLG